MIKLKTNIEETDWIKLVDLLDKTDMCIGLGRQRASEKIRRAYENSYKLVVAYDNDKMVGTARIISDGECYGWVHDVVVDPDYRKQGLGKLIMDKLIEDDKNLLIGLTSSFEAVDFYLSLGFKKHKTAMALYPGQSSYLIYD